ncbi:MAG TPA: amino acid adenylation domain-containing protein [Longimicrobium sp.]|nr:amino acid adenylation domain-containing protein [Longimicrobium sp.]
MSLQQTIDSPELSTAERAILEARLRELNPRAQIVPRAPGGEAPLSFSQERMWFLHRMGQGEIYTLAIPLRLSAALDAAALERSLGEVVRRHDSLRTTFREVDGVPVQTVAPFAGFALPVEDVPGADEAEREAEARRRVAEETARPFDLVAGPLFRARLLRLEPTEHVLIVCMHHIVSDGWSTGVLFREMWALYAAYTEGRESPLPPLPLQYADYAAWQRREWRGLEARSLAYWMDRLGDAPTLLELPADHPRPPAQSFRGGTVPVNVPRKVAEGLREVGRSEDATPFMVVLAAFQVLLGRYAASEDVLVGTLVPGRARPETQGLIGLFTHTLVLRADLGGDPSFREMVRRARQTVLGAHEHQDLPFGRLLEELQPERSLSHSSLFQVLYQLDEAEGPPPAPRPGPRVRTMEPARQTARFDLSLLLHAGERGIGGVLEYSADLFERGTVRRMVQHLERVLEQAAADPDRHLSRLELMSRTDRDRVVAWNRTTARYPADRCIHHLFADQAARTPDAPAVVCGGESLTYRELDARANRLAHHLARLGVGPEVRVGLCLERSPQLMVALLGVLKAGGAYVPMDPGHPAERLAYMLDDSGVAVLLTEERLRASLPARDGIRVIGLDGEWARIAAEGGEAPPESGVTSENLCYVIYTSGSTGRPKGVAMHHRGVCNYIHWGVRAYGANSGNGAPVFTSMSVDLTVTNLLPLFAGRPVHLLPEASPIEALAETLKERPGFGLIKITPIHLGLLNALLTPEQAAGAAGTLVIGADFLSAEPTVFWQEHAPGVRLMNEYGPTETVVGCSAYVLPPGRHRVGAVPVGHPIQNLTFYVLDARGEPVPVGLPGELYIGGAGVARGYLGRPGLSAEKFLPDPFAQAGARMYRTGDRARWLADGNLMILGRTDNQVKLRAYRVELGEVEAVLRRHEGVRECLAMVREDRPGDRRLVAYVVGRADADALGEHARRSLPEYMVPTLVMLDAFPQTSTGKVDRRALPAPEHAGACAEPEAPRSFVEVQLLHLWEELLGVSPIGPTQDFFELGGNSLLALRLFAQVRSRLGCDLPLATLFAGTTVRQMAEAVLEERRGGAAPAWGAGPTVVPLQPHGTLPPLFCVHPAGRDVHGYIHLVRHLGGDQPVFGLRDGGAELHRPLAQIAAGHVGALRAVQPEGPYHLLGWSFGGTVAYEMAVELERQGQQVAFLGMLDTPGPGAVDEAWGEMEDAELVAGLAGDVAVQMGRPFDLAPDALRGLTLEEQLHRAADALHAQGAAPPGFESASLRESYEVVKARSASREGYVPGRFGGRVTVFEAQDLSAGMDPEQAERIRAAWSEEERRTLFWCRVVDDRVEVHGVPGTHVSIGMEPHVRVLAERVRASLAAARAAV